MPELQRKTFGSGSKRWLGSTHGIRNARSSVLDISAFTAATHYPNGYIPSGTPVNAADESAVTPWTGEEGEVLGFVLDDRPVAGAEDLNAAVLRHGLINVAHVPGTFTTPEAGAAGFVFIEGSDA